MKEKMIPEDLQIEELKKDIEKARKKTEATARVAIVTAAKLLAARAKKRG